MDWIKIKTQHVLFSGLTPSEKGMLVMVQALTAHLERVPTEKEIVALPGLSRKAIERLSESLRTINADLSEVLRKVIEDVSEVHQKREAEKIRKRNLRSKQQNVPRDKEGTSHGHPIREEKNREDKSREDNKKEEVVQQDSVDKTVDPPPSQNSIPKNYLKETQEVWNSFAEKTGLSPIRQINDQRRAGIKARLKEPEFDIGEVFREIESSSFLRGENNRGWKVDFDFVFCSSSNWLKIVEGKYRGNGRKTLSMEDMWDALG